ncbi:citrate synthase [Novipirellula artificiosorum]|uniref:Citrate synthase n=1 Tax=Novipirellula artificiosorum TaxID=2528016 RepID=A0A5C6E090_9BACT|nr:citrate synthase [Novipirellula artificiosorum]TWU42135.1 Citrate synthase 1 [Novipirellula artificiosorum]
MNHDSHSPQSYELDLGDRKISLPAVVGTENERGFDISKLRDETGVITVDEGYRNTGSVKSAITYIDGENGILRYRGIPIEQLAEKSTFIETALLLMYGELPSDEHLTRFRELLTEHQMIHEGMRNSFLGYPPSGHPMAILSSMINTLSCYSSDVMEMEDEVGFENAAARLLSKIRTVAAYAYKTSMGKPLMYPDPKLSYCRNFLHLMFSLPSNRHEQSDEIVRALSLFLILHADHEQNCSTATVRMVGSSGANLFASCAAGVCALWGPLHGGANVAVMQQLKKIHESGEKIKDLIERVKRKEEKLYGFGHGVYKSYDPRANILRDQVTKIVSKHGRADPLLDVAKQLEEIALSDDYFVSRKLYPNVDFYSGILLRTIGIPLNMYTVMFAMGRMPGWMAQWKEVRDTDSRIYRPRQIYVGPQCRDYVEMKDR